MKSYTNIPQSKKLAEKLPLQSADMHYERVYFEGKKSDWFIQLGRPIKSDDIIPAWSLSALLELMPIETHLYKMQDEGNYTKHYYKVGSFDGKGWIELNNTLAIDAVYDMVCWLLENKKL